MMHNLRTVFFGEAMHTILFICETCNLLTEAYNAYISDFAW